MWLGEAGQSLIRAVDHEIPHHRKQSAQLQQQLIDLERRHVDLLKSAASAAKEYKQVGAPGRISAHHASCRVVGRTHWAGRMATSWGVSKVSKWSHGSTFEAAWQTCALLFAQAPVGVQECASLGLEGPSIQEGVLQLRQALPDMFADSLAQLQHPQVAQAVHYYAAFTACAHPREQSTAGQSKQSLLLPTLNEVLLGRIEPLASLATPAAALEASTASSARADPPADTSAAADNDQSSGADKAGQDTATSQPHETQGISRNTAVAPADFNGAVRGDSAQGTGWGTGMVERQLQGDDGSANNAQDPAAVALRLQPAAVQRLVQVRV